MRAEQYWQAALARSRTATAEGALVPLQTAVVPAAGWDPFVLRRLLGATPKHLRAAGPKPNPFLPWDRALEVDRLTGGHVLLLNKYPVQPGHVLVIPSEWRPQSGWLEPADWEAVLQVDTDTTGLWFFNSCAAAGASQPHRHLQLLPRAAGEPVCPLEPQLLDRLQGKAGRPAMAWAHALSPRTDPGNPAELEALYHQHCQALGLGCPQHDPQPKHPYNLLFGSRWLFTIRRSHEHCAGFSVNALGFAGYLLATEVSDLNWLKSHGPWHLLAEVGS